MPVKRKPDQSIIEALNKAQHIAFGPVLFQAVRSALATGLLSHISEAEDTEAEAARKQFQALMDQLPEWKFTDDNVPMVVLPGLEPEHVGGGRDYVKPDKK